MASLRKRRGNWYGRIRGVKHGKRFETNIPLNTQSKVTAMERFMEVRKVERHIKEGMNFTFPWLSNVNQTEVKRFELNESINQWMNKRKGKLAYNTTVLNQQGLSYLIDVLGKTYPLKSIDSHHIEKYVDYLENKGLSNTSINIHLRTIKSMFNHYKNMDKLDKIPFIKSLSIPKSEPIYITDDEFQSIMDIEGLGDFYKRVFLLYRETGMRLREPMMSTLNGNWIDIPNTSKSKQGRNIELNDHLRDIFIEFKAWLTSGYGSTLKDCGDHLSKRFRKCLNKVGVNHHKHFHSLRHTFAVRQLISGTSIYELKLLMGHHSVTTTEVYSNMNLKRVAYDFPTLTLLDKKGKGDTVLGDTQPLYVDYV